MVLASIVAVVVGLMFTLLIARILYQYSLKKGLLSSKRDYIINGAIIGFTFFCISSFVYVGVLNIQ